MDKNSMQGPELVESETGTTKSQVRTYQFSLRALLIVAAVAPAIIGGVVLLIRLVGIGHLLFLMGLLMCLGGVIAEIRSIWLCMRVVAATSDRPDGLQPVEAWLNIYHFRKREKLHAIALSEPPESDLRSLAMRALKADSQFYLQFIPGMLLAWLGASMTSR